MREHGLKKLKPVSACQPKTLMLWSFSANSASRRCSHDEKKAACGPSKGDAKTDGETAMASNCPGNRHGRAARDFGLGCKCPGLGSNHGPLCPRRAVAGRHRNSGNH